jgi:protein TonB
MKTKKSSKADLENKRVLFVEIGLVVALAVVLGAFEYKTYEKNVSMITADLQTGKLDREQIPITMEDAPATAGNS